MIVLAHMQISFLHYGMKFYLGVAIKSGRVYTGQIGRVKKVNLNSTFLLNGL